MKKLPIKTWVTKQEKRDIQKEARKRNLSLAGYLRSRMGLKPLERGGVREKGVRA
jgi:hypothetical protein